MARKCENCIHDKVCNMWAVDSGIPFVNADTCEHYKPTIDGALKSATEKPMFENTRNILHHLKRQIHDKAVYPHNAGIDAYITLKALDSVLNNFMKNYGG